MTFNHLRTNSTKLAHYRLKIRNVIEFFDFQSLMQHPPLFYNSFTNLHHLSVNPNTIIDCSCYCLSKIWIEQDLFIKSVVCKNVEN